MSFGPIFAEHLARARIDRENRAESHTPPRRTRWGVRVQLEDGTYQDLAIGTDKRTWWLSKRAAERHAQNWQDEHGRDASVAEL